METWQQNQRPNKPLLEGQHPDLTCVQDLAFKMEESEMIC